MKKRFSDEHERHRFGYRRIWQLLHPDTPGLTWPMD